MIEHFPRLFVTWVEDIPLMEISMNALNGLLVLFKSEDGSKMNPAEAYFRAEFILDERIVRELPTHELAEKIRRYNNSGIEPEFIEYKDTNTELMYPILKKEQDRLRELLKSGCENWLSAVPTRGLDSKDDHSNESTDSAYSSIGSQKNDCPDLPEIKC